MHITLEENTSGRDFIMGDLHGCYNLLMDALKHHGFSPETDRLISVGDIIDRGPDSEKCLKLLGLPWFHMVRGNHEQMMIDSVLHDRDDPWKTSYGRWTQHMTLSDLLDWALQFAALPTSLTLDCGDFKAGICHAEPPGASWQNVHNPASDTQMLWGRKTLKDRPKTPVTGVDITIHGHTPLQIPAWVSNRYFMDTGAWDTGTLTVRNVRDIWTEYQGPAQLFKP